MSSLGSASATEDHSRPSPQLQAQTQPATATGTDNLHLSSYYTDPGLSTPLFPSLLQGLTIPQNSQPGASPARTWIPRNRPTWDEDPTTPSFSQDWSYNAYQPPRATSYPLMATSGSPSYPPPNLRTESLPLDPQSYSSPTYSLHSLNPYSNIGSSYGMNSYQQPYDAYNSSSQPSYTPSYHHHIFHSSPWPQLSPYPPPPPALQSWSAPPALSASPSYSNIKPELDPPNIPSNGNVKRRLPSEESGTSEGEKRPKRAVDFHRIHGIYASILGSMQHIQPASASASAESTESVPLQSIINMSASALEITQKATFTSRTIQQSSPPPKAPPKAPSKPSPKIIKTEAESSSKPTPLAPVRKEREKSQSKKEAKITRCLGCNTTETPEWRKGPMGPRTLCNACGLVFAKVIAKRKKLAAKEAAVQAKTGLEDPQQ